MTLLPFPEEAMDARSHNCPASSRRAEGAKERQLNCQVPATVENVQCTPVRGYQHGFLCVNHLLGAVLTVYGRRYYASRKV